MPLPLMSLLLRLTAGAIWLLTAAASALYAGYMIAWMHAPPAAVLLVTAALAALPVALGCACLWLGRRIAPPGRP